MRDGSLEVAFTGPEIAVTAANSGESVIGMRVSTGEQAELAELRAMRERAEEFG